MKRIVILILLLSTLALSGCGFTGFRIVTGSGKIVEETREVSDFDAVDFSGSGEVTIIQGDEEGIRIEADENIMPYLRTEVRGHTLHIFIDHTNFLSIETGREMRFYVSMKEVTGFDLSGSGSITSNEISAKDLEVDISGSGDIDVDKLQADSLTVDVSGSGRCSFKGEAATQKLTISGSGRCDNSNLDSKDVKIDISGSGAAFVNAADTLRVNISGSGDVTYTGNPKITQDISGSGDLISR